MDETRIAVITGAASGIGLGLAKAAADRGHRIYLVDTNEEALARAASAIGSQAVPVATDVADPEAMQQLAKHVFSTDGRVDYLFNNAGIARAGLSWTISAADWRKTIEVNLLGVAYGICSFVQPMIDSKLPCHIINNASAAGLVPAALLGPYTASKFGIVALTEALAIELDAQHSVISVHLMAPGPVRTSIYEGATPDDRKDERVEMMRKYTEQTGVDPHGYGHSMFEAIDRGEFWIISHPEIVDAPLQARTERILKREAPTAQQMALDPRT